MNRIDPKHPAAYEEDFALWSAEQAARIREGRLDGLDRENLAEEIESLGISQRSEIESRMNILLTHLLKWKVQPARRSNSWRATIAEQRMRIARLVRASPSLKPYPAKVIGDEYPLARLHASAETGLSESDFPETCPYTIEQILDPHFLPD
jgi:hypothetical protein